MQAVEEGGSAGETNEAPGESKTTWSVLGPHLLQEQLLVSPAMSHTVPGEGLDRGSILVSSVLRLPMGAPRHLGSQMRASAWACQGNGMSGELTFGSPSQSALRNVLGSLPVFGTWWAGRRVAGVSRTAGRGRKGMRMSVAARAAFGKMKASKACPSGKENSESPTTNSHCM